MRALKLIDDRFEEFLGCILLAIVVLLTFFGVVARLAFSSGLPWQEEITRMLFVLMVYLGASYSVMKSDHIRVTLLVDILPGRANRALELLADAAAIAFHLTIFWLAGREVIKMSAFPATDGVLKIPLYLIFAVVPTMFLLMAFRQTQKLWRARRADRREGRS